MSAQNFRCGICVGGGTGNELTKGVDRCNVCFGSNECVGCDGKTDSLFVTDDCGRCLEKTSPLINNCTRIVNVNPSVLDRAVFGGESVVITLRGPGITPVFQNRVKCSFVPQTSGNKEIPVKFQTVENEVIQMEFVYNDYQGVFDISCILDSDKKIEVASNIHLALVDSKDLIISSAKPEEAISGRPIQMKLSISSVRAGDKVLCYFRRKGSELATVLPAVEILDGSVTCSTFIPGYPCILEVGVTYTEYASLESANLNQPALVTVRSPAPKAMRSVFTDDLQFLKIFFDQNIEGPNNCADIFTPESFALLGDGAECYFLANYLMIQLGYKPEIRPDSTLYFSAMNNIFPGSSDHSLTDMVSGNVRVEVHPGQIFVPTYQADVPRLACNSRTGNSSLIRLTPTNGQTVQYEVLVKFNISTAEKVSHTQASNLKLWDKVRRLQKNLTRQMKLPFNGKIMLNTSELMPGIDYHIVIKGRNALGMYGEELLMPILVSREDSKIEVIITGPSITRADHDFTLEAKVISCSDSSGVKYVYEWELEDPDRGTIALPNRKEARSLRGSMEADGKRLFVSAGSLQGKKNYGFICKLKSESDTIIAKTKHKITVFTKGLQPVLPVSAVTLGTGHSLVLNASLSYDPDNLPGELQFTWCCSTKDGKACLTPSSLRTIAELYPNSFNSAVLKLPPGSLILGEYNFTVIVGKENSWESASTIVKVVGGNPPTFIISPKRMLIYVNPKIGVTIPAEVGNVRSGCRLWWSLQEQTGYHIFDFGNIVKQGDMIKLNEQDMAEIDTSFTKTKEFPLIIPGPTNSWSGLKGDTQYKFRVSASCPPKNYSGYDTLGYADIVIKTNAPPEAKPIMVNPKQGEALKTQFIFTTEPARDSMADLPLQYKYGYRVEGQEQENIFRTSSEDLQANTILPSDFTVETNITPLLEVCDVHHVCSLQQGDKVKTLIPSSLSSEEIMFLSSQLENLLETHFYDEAKHLCVISLKTMQQMADPEPFNKTVKLFSKLVQNEIKQMMIIENKTETWKDLSTILIEMTVQLVNLKWNEELYQEMTKLRKLVTQVSMAGGENEASKRRKRQTQLIMEMTTKQIEVILTTYEIGIKNSDLVSQITDLLNDIPNILKKMCMYPGVDNEKSVGISSIQLAVWVRNSQIILNENFKLPSNETQPGSFKFQSVLLDEGDKICVTSVFFTEDYLMQAANKNKNPKYPPPLNFRISGLHQLLKMETGSWRTDERSPVYLKIPIHQNKISPEQTLQCMHWENGWKSDSCKTLVINNMDNVKFVECNCSVLAYFSVFMVNAPPTTTTSSPASSSMSPITTTTDPTTTTQSITTTTTSEKSYVSITDYSSTVETLTFRSSDVKDSPYFVEFRIHEEFNETVGEKKEEFAEKLLKQIIQKVRIPPNMILLLEVIEGSILVRVKLVHSDDNTIQEVAYKIVDVLKTGSIDLRDLKERKLQVDGDTVVFQYPRNEEKSYIAAIAAGGTVAISAILVATTIATAIVIRKKKEKQRLLLIQANNQRSIPAYRQFPFEDSIDGSEASLAKYRNNLPSMGTVSTLRSINLPSINKDTSFSQFQDSVTKNKKKKKRQSKRFSRNLANEDVASMEKGSKEELNNLPGTPTGSC